MGTDAAQPGSPKPRPCLCHIRSNEASEEDPYGVPRSDVGARGPGRGLKGRKEKKSEEEQEEEEEELIASFLPASPPACEGPVFPSGCSHLCPWAFAGGSMASMFSGVTSKAWVSSCGSRLPVPAGQDCSAEILLSWAKVPGSAQPEDQESGEWDRLWHSHCAEPELWPWLLSSSWGLPNPT